MCRWLRSAARMRPPPAARPPHRRSLCSRSNDGPSATVLATPPLPMTAGSFSSARAFELRRQTDASSSTTARRAFRRMRRVLFSRHGRGQDTLSATENSLPQRDRSGNPAGAVACGASRNHVRLPHESISRPDLAPVGRGTARRGWPTLRAGQPTAPRLTIRRRSRPHRFTRAGRTASGRPRFA